MYSNYIAALNEQVSSGNIVLYDGELMPQDSTRAKCTLLRDKTTYPDSSAGSYWDSRVDYCNPDFFDSQINVSWKDYIANKSQFWTGDRAHYNCIAEKDTYQRGFSGEWIFLALVLHTVWTMGTAIIWLDAQANSQCYQKGRRMGPYRALTDLGEAIRRELGPDTGAYSEEELAAATRKRPSIKYRVEERDGHSRIALTPGPSAKVQLDWDKEYG